METITRAEVIKQLRIKEPLLRGITKHLIRDKDYIHGLYKSRQFGASGLREYLYTPNGIKAIKHRVKDLQEDKKRVENLHIILNIPPKSKVPMHVWARKGIIEALTENGLHDSEIAYTIQRDRTTVLSAKKSPITANDTIAYAVKEAAKQKCLEALKRGT